MRAWEIRFKIPTDLETVSKMVPSAASSGADRPGRHPAHMVSAQTRSTCFTYNRTSKTEVVRIHLTSGHSSGKVSNHSSRKIKSLKRATGEHRYPLQSDPPTSHRTGMGDNKWASCFPEMCQEKSESVVSSNMPDALHMTIGTGAPNYKLPTSRSVSPDPL
ncbi:hypothetical protein U0070_007466 [Myodes glareolus]|uniref:Uncharacterized protein n=1 Tax=Myodes glareolus TaxID=447135 RepID=A0AAW0I725_MYOGA